MGYKIKKVMVKNFKYINAEKPLVIQLENADMVVLNGQNGYGKTSFFDALELLFVSKIDHMTLVANRQTTNELEDVVFDNNKDIDITVVLENENGKACELRRIFDHSKSFESRIYWNNEEITSKELQSRLGYSENTYGMGIYMSQTKSLTFLEKKLKDRKSIVAELVNTKKANDKVLLISDVSKGIKTKIEEKQKELDGNKERISIEIERLQQELRISSETSQIEKPYNKLFPEKDYIFDKENIDITNSFRVIVEPLTNIKSYVSDYDCFMISQRNEKIRKGISLPKQLFVKKYYINIINELNDKKDNIERIKQAIQYKREIDSGKYTIHKSVCLDLGINEMDLESVAREYEKLNTFTASLSNNEEILLSLNKKRNDLIAYYHHGTESGVINKNVCPLCGVSHTVIESVFKTVEESLISTIASCNESKQKLETSFIETFNSIIVEPLNRYLKNNALIYNNYMQLSNYMNLDIEELSALLHEYKIEFECVESIAVDFSEFDKVYINVIDALKSHICEEKKIITPELIEIYKVISSEYYNGQKPTHTVLDIDNKITYIANCYASESRKKLQKLIEGQEKLQVIIEDFRTKSDRLQNYIGTLSKKYSDAFKDYQTKLVAAIRIPVLIYSGKIIQNYPLGLGINTKIASNQLSFEPFEKEGTDVINILSTGQLNGLAISIMLAVRSVYGKREGLDFILVDDPLQTIDDISAISLADLLLNSDISQVIVSTHEDRKAKMLEYKYKQRYLAYKQINMQREYFDYKNR